MKTWRLTAITSLLLATASSSGCGSLLKPKVLVDRGAIIHLLGDTPAKAAGVESDPADPSKIDVIEGGVVVPAGYVCVPPQAIQ